MRVNINLSCGSYQATLSMFVFLQKDDVMLTGLRYIKTRQVITDAIQT